MERDEEILRLWKDELMTLSAIGKKYGLTRERVRQIVAKQRAKNVSDIRAAGNGKDDNAS